MPKIIRTMREQNGMPAIGTDSNMLGACIPQAGEEEKPYDIRPDDKGMVYPDTGGISVARSIRDLPNHLVPKRLRHLFPTARGNDNRFVWGMGDGDFSEGAVATLLMLRLKPNNSDDQILGLLEPDATMPLEDYQAALTATQRSWSIDEPT